MKTCSKCRTLKPLTEFHRDKHRKQGVANACKVCRAARHKADYAPREVAPYYAANRDRIAVYQRFRKFGVTRDQYDALLEKQGGCCAICRTPAAELSRALAVDHDHATGTIRGLLCLACNTALGKFREREENLLAAIEYLRRHK
jgi:hypothetical protein